MLIDGHPAGSLPARAALAYLSDSPTFYEDLSVWEHLEYVARLHGHEDWEQDAADLLDHLGLYDRADDLPTSFSRGLRQKASIAMAFIRPFDVLLVDEPFVGLDASGKAALMELLDRGPRRRAHAPRGHPRALLPRDRQPLRRPPRRRADLRRRVQGHRRAVARVLSSPGRRFHTDGGGRSDGRRRASADGLLCRFMHEYSSVSASSYDPGALVAKLNEAAADGWDVVAIVPTGGDVSAFLRRGGGEATAEAGDPTGEMELVGATAAEEVAVEEPETAAAGEGWAGGEVAAADAALTDAGAEATDGVDSATDVIDVVEVTEVPAAEAAAAGAAGEAAAAVDEPAGWAVAPDSANDAAPAAEEIPVVATGSRGRGGRARGGRAVTRSGAGARAGTGPRAGTRRHDAGRLVPGPLDPLRAALLGRHPVDRARRPPGAAVHGPARPLSVAEASRPPVRVELPGR